MNAVMAVQWPITFGFSEDSRYNTLLQISVGQEEVDEVIGRDINRTFPEHPQFGFEQGQQALYRVLKAYSLHDLEVGYCQVGWGPNGLASPAHHLQRRTRAIAFGAAASQKSFSPLDTVDRCWCNSRTVSEY